MADIMNVTSPVQGHETANRVRPENPNEQQTGIYQAPDPSRVPKSQETNVQGEQNNPFSPNLESNFEKFLQMLKASPEMIKSYVETFYSKMGNLVLSGMEEGITAEIAQYMDMLKMSEGKLFDLLKNQQGMTVKFHGPLFDLMRELLHSDTSVDLKRGILDFLRKYDDLTASGHIFENIRSNLKNIGQRLPKSMAEHLTQLAAKLQPGLLNGQQQPNLAILKTEIIPFLSAYIRQTKDYSSIRDLITMLTLNLARYESGAKEPFLEAFHRLLGYGEVSRRLEGIDRQVFAEQLMAMKHEDESGGLNQKLAQIISGGVKGEAGYQNKAVFQNLMSSILLNESVYVPLLHFILPADVGGRQFFSEMWIDPDDQSGNRQESGGGERAIRLLIKFDIRDLGYFEMVLLYQDGKVDMELSYPPALESRKKQIREGLNIIMDRNQMSFQSLALAVCDRPKAISEVFPKIFERRNTINVTI